MAEVKEMLYTEERKLVEELEELKVERRKEIAQKIKEAREQGDLSENAEYDAAKEEQGKIEARITEIEEMLKNVVIIDDSDIDAEKINMGCTVEVYDEEFEEDLTFQIVGATGVSSLEGKISNESPIGKALIGHKVGDVVEVEAPAGVMAYRVLKIERSL